MTGAELMPPWTYRVSKIKPITEDRIAKLSQREFAELTQIRSPKRREAYISGRITARCLLADYAALSSHVEILSREPGGRSCRPRVYIDGQLNQWHVSLSHRADKVLVAIATRPLGCDLESITELPESFQAMWYTDQERDWLNSSPGTPSSTIWAVKEAAYKAVNRGEGFRPETFHVRPTDGTHWTCTTHSGNTRINCRVSYSCSSVVALAITSPRET